MSTPLETVLEQELDTARTMVETPGRAVIVVGVVVEGENGYLARSVTQPATRRDALTMAEGLERECRRLRQLARSTNT